MSENDVKPYEKCANMKGKKKVGVGKLGRVKWVKHDKNGEVKREKMGEKGEQNNMKKMR